MEKVQMVIRGRNALVDADQVKKIEKKMALVDRARVLQDTLKQMQSETVKYEISKQLDEVMYKIIRLNRTIRQNVRFL